MVRLSLVLVAVLLASSGSALGLTNAAPLDGDATPPLAELFEGTDPTATDTDGDGLSDTVELGGRSDARVADTDADGLGDGVEVADHGSNPTEVDSDGDALADGREVGELGTDPAAGDTDADGVTDSGELDAGLDPTSPDTDADGLRDGRELATAGVDPADPDSDADGLRDGREDELGTDPARADTDGDAVSDGEEVDGGTDPLAADTDADGLDDAREAAGATDALAPDTDEDGLEDGAEVDRGTDPVDPDTDGDRLPDGWEVAGETPDGAPLPGGDPGRMDLYVSVVAETGSNTLSDREVRRLRDAWARMPVDNPDGSTGIAMHVADDGRLDEPVVYDGDFDALYREHYVDGLDGARRGVYHRVLIVRFADDYERVGGVGQTPGRFSVVRDDFSGARTDRYETVVHELLHNVMGRLDEANQCGDDAGHSCSGWLTATAGERHLPEGLAREIERDGFE